MLTLHDGASGSESPEVDVRMPDGSVRWVKAELVEREVLPRCAEAVCDDSGWLSLVPDDDRAAMAAEVVFAAGSLGASEIPPGHRGRIRTNNAIERLNREIRRRTSVAGTFPNGRSALMLVNARLKSVAQSVWSSRCYLEMSLLEEAESPEVGQSAQKS